MRAARMKVTTYLIERALHLPRGATIVGARMDPDEWGALELIVEDPSLPEDDGPHEANPVITEREPEFDWGIE